MLARTRVTIGQSSSVVCGDIVGFDFKDYDAGDIAEVRKYWLQYGVLRFRETDITDAQQVAFSRHFGEFVIHPKQLQEGGHPTHKEILVIATSSQSTLWEAGGICLRVSRSVPCRLWHHRQLQPSANRATQSIPP